MKLYLSLFLMIIALAGMGQDYEGATPYWERQNNQPDGTPGSYIKSGGSLLIAGDIFMLGSAATALVGIINYNNASADLDILDENYQEDSDKVVKQYNTTLTVSGAIFGVGFIMRMAGHAKLKTGGELLKLNNKTALNVTNDGLTLAYKF